METAENLTTQEEVKNENLTPPVTRLHQAEPLPANVIAAVEMTEEEKLEYERSQKRHKILVGLTKGLDKEIFSFIRQYYVRPVSALIHPDDFIAWLDVAEHPYWDEETGIICLCGVNFIVTPKVEVGSMILRNGDKKKLISFKVPVLEEDEPAK
jgi:hypothetical protein